jgi:biopolymer transport protein ExbD
MKIEMEAAESGMDMTPMIDVVFLLIIFFMLVAQFTQQVLLAGIVLPQASESMEDDPGKRLVINVADNGDYYVRGIIYPKEALKTQVKAYGQLKKIEYMGMMISDMKVMIRSDRYTAYRHIQDVYFLLGDATIWKICFATLRD